MYTAETWFALVFGSFGLAFIAGQSKISLPIRKLIEPPVDASGLGPRLRLLLLDWIECPGCLSWHVGFDLFIFGVLPYPEGWSVVQLLVGGTVLGCILAGTSMFLAKVSGLID